MRRAAIRYAALTMGGLLLAAAPATAGQSQTLSSGPLLYVSTNAVASPGGDGGTPVASCGGEAVLGGGGGLEGSNAEGHLFRSSPTVSADRWLFDWKTAAHNTGGSQATVSNVAICQRGSYPGVFAGTGGFAQADGSDVSGSVDCGHAGIVGYGLDWDGPGEEVSILALGPISFADANFRGLNTRSEPYPPAFWRSCTNLGRTKLSRRHQRIDPGETQSLRAPCPHGTKVTGGGGATYGAKSLSRPYDSRDRRKAPDDGWVVRTHFEGSVSTQNVVQAICLKV